MSLILDCRNENNNANNLPLLMKGITHEYLMSRLVILPLNIIWLSQNMQIIALHRLSFTLLRKIFDTFCNDIFIYWNFDHLICMINTVYSLNWQINIMFAFYFTFRVKLHICKHDPNRSTNSI